MRRNGQFGAVEIFLKNMKDDRRKIILRSFVVLGGTRQIEICRVTRQAIPPLNRSDLS